jgi:Arc/MetJ-type ribon-helix-helix transcriptional regulator
LISFGIMTTQINLRLSESMLTLVRKHSESKGFENIQDFIRETIREKIFGEPELTPKEFALVKRIIDSGKKRNLFGTEEELFKKLRE